MPTGWPQPGRNTCPPPRHVPTNGFLRSPLQGRNPVHVADSTGCPMVLFLLSLGSGMLRFPLKNYASIWTGILSCTYGRFVKTGNRERLPWKMPSVCWMTLLADNTETLQMPGQPPGSGLPYPLRMIISCFLTELPPGVSSWICPWNVTCCATLTDRRIQALPIS